MKRNSIEKFNASKETIVMDNLKNIIKKRNYTMTKVAINTEINESTLYRYLGHTLIPSLPNLIILADFLQCNLDYLVGRTNNPNLYETLEDEEIQSIIYMIKLLSKDERKIVNILIQNIINEREKINN